MSPNVYRKGVQMFGRKWLKICELSHNWSHEEAWGEASAGI